MSVTLEQAAPKAPTTRSVFILRFLSAIVLWSVALVIAFPALVMHYKGAGTGIDPNKVKIEIEMPDMPAPLDFGPPPAKQ